MQNVDKNMNKQHREFHIQLRLSKFLWIFWPTLVK